MLVKYLSELSLDPCGQTFVLVRLGIFSFFGISSTGLENRDQNVKRDTSSFSDFINEQALNTPDIPYVVPYVSGTVRGRKWQEPPKQVRKSESNVFVFSALSALNMSMKPFKKC